MGTYYRWISEPADLLAAKNTSSLQVSRAPRHCCWVFDMSGYKPAAGVQSGSVLVAFEANASGEAIIRNRALWVDFLSQAYRGDVAHPDGIIVKPNEPGAFGIGANLLQGINACLRARLANRNEMSRALGNQVPQSQIDIRMRRQRW